VSEFTRIVCWTPDVVARTVTTEAIEASPSVFLATHSPLRIRRRLASEIGRHREVIVTEEQVVREFLDQPAAGGVVIAPILGETGAGKSQVIKWARTRIKSNESRVVIYLAREGQGLKDVVGALVSGGTGPVFDEIRAKLGSMGATLTLDALRHKLLDELALAVMETEAKSPYEKALVGNGNLNALLHDAFFKRHLLFETSFISRRAALILGLPDPGTGDAPTKFTVEELPLEVAQIEDAGLDARRVFRQLSSQPPMQEAALDLLNRNFDVAVMNATSLGVGQVQQAFLELRRELVGKKEIILLIEDLALIQGVQRDLLDAIIQLGRLDGREEYATIRTLLAVTSGFYADLPETFTSRVDSKSPVYVVDQALSGTGGITQDEMVSFIGRYLNAARVGADALDSARVADGGATPNACIECDYQVPCEAAFGKSAEGYGLYPYNALALDRAVRSATLDGKPELFNPRYAIARVVGSVLANQADDLRSGVFPSDSFSDLLPAPADAPVLPNAARARLDEILEPTEAARRATFLEFWGGASAKVANLKPAIQKAFDLADLPPDVFQDVAEPHRTPGGDGPDPRPSTSLERKISGVDNWGKKKKNADKKDLELDTDVANELRTILRDAIASRISWADPIMVLPNEADIAKALPNRATVISIERAREGNVEGARPLLSLKQTPANAEFFKGLLRANAGLEEDTESARAHLESLASDAAPAARVRVLEKLGGTDAKITSVIAVLLYGAALCGRLPSPWRTSDLIDAAVWSGTEHCRADTSWRSESWLRAERDHLIARPAVVELLRSFVGGAQGRGAPYAIDSDRVARLVKQAVKADSLPASNDLPDLAKPALRPLLQLDSCCTSQLMGLGAHIVRVRMQVPLGITYAETMDALSEAVRDGGIHGFAVADDRSVVELQDYLSEARQWSFRRVEELEAALAKAGDGPLLGRLALIGVDFGADPASIEGVLETSSKWVERGLLVAAARVLADDDGVETRLQGLADDWARLSTVEE
jgi:hypothetical protein